MTPVYLYCHTGTTHWSFRGPDRTAAVKINGRFTTSTIEGVHQTSLGGLGTALLSNWMAGEDLVSGALEEARLSDAAPVMLLDRRLACASCDSGWIFDVAASAFDLLHVVRRHSEDLPQHLGQLHALVVFAQQGDVLVRPVVLFEYLLRIA